jgi:hypothetical protein
MNDEGGGDGGSQSVCVESVPGLRTVFIPIISLIESAEEKERYCRSSLVQITVLKELNRFVFKRANPLVRQAKSDEG